MNNFILLFINALAHVGVFTKKEAEALCKEMQSSTLPDSFEASHRLVGDIFKKLELDARLGEKVFTSLIKTNTAVVKAPTPPVKTK